MTITISDGYELRRSDELNWQLWRLSAGRDGAPKWRPMGRYYQRLEDALSDVYERELRDSEPSCDLQGAIEAARAIAASLSRTAGEAR